VLAFSKIVNADMPVITKTLGDIEGVQFDFKQLFIKVTKKEVCDIYPCLTNFTDQGTPEILSAR